MDKLFIYIGEFIVVLGIFYGAYWFTLRNDIKHQLARFYLLVSVVLAMLLPLNYVSIRPISQAQKNNKPINAVIHAKQNYQTLITSIKREQTDLTKVEQEKISQTAHSKPTSTQKFSVKQLLPFIWQSVFYIYFIGIFMLLLRLLWQLNGIRRQIILHPKEKEGNIIFVYMNKDCSPYSFGNYLFVSNEMKRAEEFHSILEHEKTHIKQKHTYDVLFIELMAALFWVNPFIWMIRNSLRKTHEYLADMQVIKNGYDSSNYRVLLLEKVISAKSIHLTSTFHFRSLRQRLAMIENFGKTVSARIRFLKGIPVAIAITLSLLTAVIISCSSNQDKAFELVQIKGDGQFYNNSTTSFGYVLTANENTATTMLARTGDLISTEDDLFLYNSKEPYHFTSPSKGVVLNNAKVFSITLSDDPETVGWLQKLGSADLSSLDHIVIEKNLPANYINYLNIIVAKKPQIGLCIEDWSNDIPTIINMFDPTWLTSPDIILSGPDDLLSLPNLELLVLSSEVNQLNKPLPRLPKLKNLIISDYKNNPKIAQDFLTNNPQLEMFECLESNISDYRFLNSVKKLTSLTILDTDTTVDLKFIEDLKSLTRLSLLINEGQNWEALQTNGKFQWLVLSGNISQDKFNQCIKANNELQVLETIDLEHVDNLSALQNLQYLKALTSSDKLKDKDTPLLLSNLEYISLPVETVQDSVYMAKLQSSMPNGLIVPNDGFCMGSGWFILFAPILLVVARFRRTTSGREKEVA